jgi:SOS-response transcriptional repressor LexA
MREVLEIKGWTPAEWARRAQTSATNITRTLGPTSETVPTANTIAKLAAAAGSQPNLGAYQRVSARDIPIYILGKTMQLTDGRMIAPISTSERAFAAQVTTPHMSAAGIFKGDQVVAEPPEPKGNLEGKIVIAVDKEGKPWLGRVHAPLLTFQSPIDEPPIRLKDVEVVGVVAYVTRRVI